MAAILIFPLLFHFGLSNPLNWAHYKESNQPFVGSTDFLEGVRETIIPSNLRTQRVLLCSLPSINKCLNSSYPVPIAINNEFFESDLRNTIGVEAPELIGKEALLLGVFYEIRERRPNKPSLVVKFKRLDNMCTPSCFYSKDWIPVLQLQTSSASNSITRPKNKHRSLYNVNSSEDFVDVDVANSYSGKREQPLYVEEPNYLIVGRDGDKTRRLQPDYKDDPFIPPRGRKNLPLLESLRQGNDIFVPNRGKKDKLTDIFKYDETFFPNRGKKQSNGQKYAWQRM